MATLKDVARIAEVNISTISRFLSGKLNVTPETEMRITHAIQQTGYQPNIIAQSLRSGTNPTIAVVVPDIYQPGISGIISGIDDRLGSTEYSLTMAMSKGTAWREIEVLKNFRNLMVAGVIVIGHPFGKRNNVEALRDAIGQYTPLVFVSRNFRASSVTEICPDQENGALVLTNHLIERGYRSIGIILGSKDHPDARVKMLGYQKALASHGIDADPNWIAEGFFQASETREATDLLIRQRVRAIFCTSDMMAVSAALHLQENGYEIPRDIAIAGYGGTIWAGIFSPKLTTVDAQVEQLGRAAVERLIHYLNHPVENPRLIIQPVYLRVGNTT